MKKLYLVILISCFACKRESLPPLGREVVLHFNETQSFKDGMANISLNIMGIQDNRCPIDANCVRLGKVFVDLAINENEFKLCLGCKNQINVPNAIVFKDRKYELIEVSPLPYLAQPSSQEDKIVTISIN